mmetsp:Transcript_172700/g.553518  ORF Transcript_172700/g.553518 Transcript_172700/m.553518 type:complete len:374 (+) Transcript_172700:235-1356(+)
MLVAEEAGIRDLPLRRLERPFLQRQCRWHCRQVGPPSDVVIGLGLQHLGEAVHDLPGPDGGRPLRAAELEHRQCVLRHRREGLGQPEERRGVAQDGARAEEPDGHCRRRRGTQDFLGAGQRLGTNTQVIGRQKGLARASPDDVHLALVFRDAVSGAEQNVPRRHRGMPEGGGELLEGPWVDAARSWEPLPQEGILFVLLLQEKSLIRHGDHRPGDQHKLRRLQRPKGAAASLETEVLPSFQQPCRRCPPRRHRLLRARRALHRDAAWERRSATGEPPLLRGVLATGALQELHRSAVLEAAAQQGLRGPGELDVEAPRAVSRAPALRVLDHPTADLSGNLPRHGLGCLRRTHSERQAALPAVALEHEVVDADRS